MVNAKPEAYQFKQTYIGKAHDFLQPAEFHAVQRNFQKCHWINSYAAKYRYYVVRIGSNYGFGG